MTSWHRSCHAAQGRIPFLSGTPFHMTIQWFPGHMNTARREAAKTIEVDRCDRRNPGCAHAGRQQQSNDHGTAAASTASLSESAQQSRSRGSRCHPSLAECVQPGARRQRRCPLLQPCRSGRQSARTVSAPCPASQQHHQAPPHADHGRSQRRQIHAHEFAAQTPSRKGREMNPR